MRTAAIVALILSTISGARAGDEPYHLNLVAGAGYNVYAGETPPYTSNAGGFSGTLRVMWKPEHRLSVGLETGYIYMYTVEETNVATDFGPTDIFGARSVVPITAVFTMDIVERLQCSVAAGLHIANGTTESFGMRVNSSSISTGAMGAVSYFWPVSDLIELGGEVKVFYTSKYADSGVSFQIAGRWTFLEW